MNGTEEDDKWMQLCLALAKCAARFDEVPVGAVVVKNDRLIGCGYNRRERRNCPTCHAELSAIEGASRTLKNWRLLNCTLYVSLEPCLMCAGAIVQARIPRIVYGALDPKAGAMGSLYNVHADPRLNHQSEVTSGCRAEESSRLLKDFFRRKRPERLSN